MLEGGGVMGIGLAGAVATLAFDGGVVVVSEETQEHLLLAGHEAAGSFLSDWDFATYLARCRSFETDPP